MAGWYQKLSNGMLENGVESDFVNWYDHQYNYSKNSRHILLALASKFQKISKLKLPIIIYIFFSPVALLFKVLSSIARGIYGFVALMKYDAFIFTWGNSLWRWNLDFYLLKLLGKKLVVNLAHGSDMRLPYASGGYQQNGMSDKKFSSYLHKNLDRLARKIRRIEKHKVKCIGAPLSSSPLASQKMINFFYLGIPCINLIKKGNREKEFLHQDQKKFRILHAPSNPNFKGTEEIRDTIKCLKNENIDFEYIEITKASNERIIAELKACDLVIDQLYSDTPMATLAAEAAYCGKPTIVGGYGFEELKKWIDPKLWPPTILCTPQKFRSTLKAFIENPKLGKDIGIKAQNFVQTKWSAKEVANRYLKVLCEDQLADSCYFDPMELSYVYGAGLNEKELKRRLKLLLNKGSLKPLGLNHNPNLEKKYYQFGMAS